MPHEKRSELPEDAKPIPEDCASARSQITAQQRKDFLNRRQAKAMEADNSMGTDDLTARETGYLAFESVTSGSFAKGQAEACLSTNDEAEVDRDGGENRMLKETDDKEQKKKVPFFSSEELTPRERESGLWPEKTPEQLQKIKHEFNQNGREPKELWVEEMRHARVLGLGESHIWSANLGMIQDTVKKLKDAGATHFAVELRQTEVDEILKTGKLTRKIMNQEEYIAMILAARDAKLTVVGVDNKLAKNDGYGPGNENRDSGMASDIENILKDRNAKVVWVVGSTHLRVDGSGKNAAEILKNKLGANQVVTVIPADNSGNLQALNDNLTRPAAVRTSDAPELATLHLGKHKFGHWDIVVAFPQALSDPYYGPYENRRPPEK